MHAVSPRVALLALAAGTLTFAACAAGNGNSSFTTTLGTGGTSTSTSNPSNGSTSTSTATANGGASGIGGSFSGSTSSGSGAGTGGGGVTYAYAHTNTQLYKFDPSAATISMQLVGSFDCIGTSTSTTTSSSSGGAPTTCAEAGGTAGCCLGNTNYYCSSTSTTVTSKTCSSGEVCTWNSSKSYYGCASGTQASAPGDNPPIACGGTSTTSSSSSGGTATEDSSMTDIAVDSMGNLWGVSEHNAYSLVIQGSTVHCAKTIPLQGVPATFYALSFVPAGVIDTNAETLLAGDTQGDLWRIDQTTGALEQHGNFGTVPADDGQGHNYPSDSSVTGTTTTVGTAWQLSGDIVFLADTANNSTTVGFATVRDCTSMGCSDTDTLIQIDPTKLGKAGTPVTGNVTLGLRGQVVKSSSCSDTTNATYGKMFGIAAWNSTIYGFSHDSYIVEIDNSTAAACAVSGTSTNLAWSGAAVTTIAPVKPPPPPMVQ